MITGEAHVAIHRGLAGLLSEGIVGRVSLGTAHLPSSRRYYLTAKGVGEAAGVLGFDTPSEFVRAYPVSREWFTLLVLRMDAVATVCRLAASLSPGTDGLRTQVDFHRRGRFDVVITLHNGRSFGVVRQGPTLRRRSLYDRLRAIAEYEYWRRPGTVLVLPPSAWEQRLTTRFCENVNLEETTSPWSPGRRWRTGTAMPGAMPRGCSAACPTRWNSSALGEARTGDGSPCRPTSQAASLPGRCAAPRCPATSPIAAGQ